MQNTTKIILEFKPKQGVFFRLSDLIFIPFFGLIFYVSCYSLTREGFDSLLIRMSNLIIVIGSFTYTFFRFILDAYHRKNLNYFLTDSEIIIESKILKKRKKRIDLKTLSGVELYEHTKGYGNIYLGNKDPFDFYNFNGLHWTNELFGRNLSYSILEYIPNSKEIYELIKKQQTIANNGYK